MTVTRELAEYIVGFDPAVVTEDARRRVKNALLDSLGIAVLGAASSVGDRVRAFLSTEGAPGPATVVASGPTYSTGTATFANAAYIHAIDYDDMGGCGGHPAVSLVSACLSTAEELDLSGDEFVSGYVAGYEAGTAIQRAIRFAKPFHGTALIGPISAALACARLRRLDVEQTIAAISLAATQSSGLRQSFGTELKPLQVANGARVGAIAALLAAHGAQGDEEILEGAEGFGACFARDPQCLKDVVASLSGPLQLTEPPSRLRAGSWVVAKPWPCCGATHDGLTAYLRAVGDRRPSDDEIAELCVDVPATPHAEGHRTEIRTGLDGKFSVRYVLAAAAHDGEVTAESFSDAQAERIVAGSLYERIVINPVATDDPSQVPGIVDDQGRWLGARVTVRLTDGTELTGRSYGDSFGLVTDREIDEKYRRCVAGRLSESELVRLQSSIRTLETRAIRDVVAGARTQLALQGA